MIEAQEAVFVPHPQMAQVLFVVAMAMIVMSGIAYAIVLRAEGRLLDLMHKMTDRIDIKDDDLKGLIDTVHEKYMTLRRVSDSERAKTDEEVTNVVSDLLDLKSEFESWKRMIVQEKQDESLRHAREIDTIVDQIIQIKDRLGTENASPSEGLPSEKKGTGPDPGEEKSVGRFDDYGMYVNPTKEKIY